MPETVSLNHRVADKQLRELRQPSKFREPGISHFVVVAGNEDFQGYVAVKVLVQPLRTKEGGGWRSRSNGALRCQ